MVLPRVVGLLRVFVVVPWVLCVWRYFSNDSCEFKQELVPEQEFNQVKVNCNLHRF